MGGRGGGREGGGEGERLEGMGHFNQLVLLHKRVTRVIYQDTFDAHTGPIFADLKLLGLDQITCSK